MSELIIIPDVHGRPFWRDAVKGHEEDRIVFLGDYLDPYAWEGITSEEAFMALIDIIALKRSHPDNVTLLLGNHDLGYLDQSICTCRMDWRRRTDIHNVLLENLDLFDLVHIKQDGDRLLGGFLHLFGHTLHNGGPINVRNHGFCLDCAEAFTLPLGLSNPQTP